MDNIASKFNLHDFIVNSCLIDPQYDDRDYPTVLYPAVQPGQLMYDNTAQAFELAVDLTSPGCARDIHRTLTRGIPWYENRGLSGCYRRDGVKAGGRVCPSPIHIERLMSEYWHPKLQAEIQSFSGTPEEALEIAWNIHHAFEYIHPFADGNGRTGRLLLNRVLMALNADPIVILYQNRNQYYESIQRFVDDHVADYLNLSSEAI